MQYPTPTPPGEADNCRALTVPDGYESIVVDLLASLTHESAWVADGSETVQDAVKAAYRILDSYVLDPCSSGGGAVIGSISAYVGDLPSGVLECDGATHARASYPDLYAALDAAFIIDADNFSVPDLRGRGVVGVGAGAGLTVRSMGDAGGAETHTLTTGEMPSHTHTVDDNLPDIDFEDIGAPQPSGGAEIPGVQSGATGGDEPHENMPPFLALRWGIIATAMSLEPVVIPPGMSDPAYDSGWLPVNTGGTVSVDHGLGRLPYYVIPEFTSTSPETVVYQVPFSPAWNGILRTPLSYDATSISLEFREFLITQNGQMPYASGFVRVRAW